MTGHRGGAFKSYVHSAAVTVHSRTAAKLATVRNDNGCGCGWDTCRKQRKPRSCAPKERSSDRFVMFDTDSVCLD